MPQPGDGDRWPTTDDDRQSEQAGDASTHKLPVPEKPADVGWFEPPASNGRDEPHAKPAQQLTQPMSWPVADLEQQAKNANTEAMSFVRPVATPEWPNEESSSPDWPGEPENDQPAAELPTPASPEGADTASPVEPADEPTDQAVSAEQDDSTQAADRTVANLAPAKPESAEDVDRGGAESPAPDEATDKGDAEPEHSPAADTEPPEPAAPEETAASDSAGTDDSAESQISEPAGQSATPDDSGADGASDTTEADHASWPADDRSRAGEPADDPGHSRGGQEAEAATPDRSPGGWFSEAEPVDPRADRPPEPTAADRTQIVQPVAGPDPTRPDRPRPSDAAPPPERPRTGSSAEATVVNLARPTPPNPPTDGPTVFLRPVQPPPPPREPDSQPPSFVRPRHDTYQAPDSATVSMPRPERASERPPPEPPRAAPQRVEPAPDEPAAPRKNKKLLVIAVAIVAVLGLAAGVVFGVPGVSDKLGLTGEDPVAIKQPPAPITYSPGLRAPDSNAPAPSPAGVASTLAGPVSNSALGTLTGLVIDPGTNQTLFERDPGNAIIPASTGKIITAATALLSLDHTQQLVTKVVQGEQPGEVIIVGGGDPTISSLKVGNESMYPGAAHLSELVDQVKASGAQVTTVYIDQSRYTGPELESTWLPEDVGAGYIAPIVPAMLDGDRRDATVNYSPRTNDPGRTLVDEFASRIGASPGASIDETAPANAKVLGEIRSAPVSQLVDNMLDRSENTLGDILAREVAIKTGQEPSFEGANKAMLDILRQNNFDVTGVELHDGSGMSTENKVSAKLLAQILAVAAGPDGKDPRTAKLRPLLGGLPVAGGSGTLAERYTQGAAAEGRGWVRAKTGTLSGVNSLAGIVLDKDNRPLVFAFLTNGSNANAARPALDAVAAALRGCGCQ
ncbi:D-alanyl-D-alanine carboxypeptidase/D-alanyl-D-alanine endopeptidase [Actinophytocola sp.]|uniref:D-alanyl-D-alanine carboxypeptidase/D-alanyl-D-alanine endopeptidase n=1 Tax=Actinophytocola sp. TaxID=1872138 RepID=UPI002ED1404D